MNILQTIMLIIVHHGNSAPLTKEDIKSFIGVFIVLNLLWIASLFYSYKIDGNLTDRKYGYGGFFDSTMSIIWGIIVICFLGYHIGKLI